MKKNYRIELTTTDSTVAKETALLAALSNGGKYESLDVIEAYAIALIKQSGYIGVSITRPIEYMLTIDKGNANLLTITETEVDELLGSEAPTLNRQVIGIEITKENQDTLHY